MSAGDARRVSGLRAIGIEIGVRSRERVIELARRRFDPLPVARLGNELWGWSPYLRDWAARELDLRAIRAVLARRPDSFLGEWSVVRPPELPVLVGMDAAARRAGRSPRTVREWCRARTSDPFPLLGVERHEERLTTGAVWAYDGAARDWLQRNSLPYGATEGRASVARGAA